METIKLKKGNAHIHYGWASLRDWTNKTGKSLNELSTIGDDMTVEQTIALIWAGMKQGARKAKTKFDLDLDDVCDLMDENPNLITKCMGIFTESMAVVESPNAEGAAVAPKKKGR